MTVDGMYYEAPFPISADHQEVDLKPEGNYFFRNGQWHPDRRSMRSPEEVIEIFNQNRVSRMPQHNPPNMYEQQAPACPPAPPPPAPPQQIPGVNAPYAINQDSQFQFKLKDVLIIAGAIASAAVSWNNADGRISHLEEKVSQEMVKKVESIERKQDEAIRRQEDSQKALQAQISDLERAITNMARK